MTSQKIRQYYTEVTISHKIVKEKKWQSYSPALLIFSVRVAKFGDDRTSFNVIFDVCDV